MLGYRHAYHAGCHGDVLKHMVLVACLKAMTQKDKPLFYMDTHAGAGMYALSSEAAQKSGEYKEGVERVWGAEHPPEMVQQYLDCIASFQPHGKLDMYPGSPAIAAALLRDDDRLWFNEMHPTDSELLMQRYSRDRRVHCVHGDGFESLKAVMPPKERRGLIVMDPSYEIKEDYILVAKSLLDAYAKFSTGVYFLWYPLVFQDKVDGMLRRLEKSVPRYLNVTLSPLPPSGEERGMHGSGVFMINPPWTLANALKDAMPWVSKQLAQSDRAVWTLDVREV
jgi:23S rRNA (adenine2030-N6)-methyltransferase